jgi:hypothetical protein
MYGVCGGSPELEGQLPPIWKEIFHMPITRRSLHMETAFELQKKRRGLRSDPKLFFCPSPSP